MAACNAQQLLHSEQDPNNMEEIVDHRHIETRERLRRLKIPANIPSVPHVQTIRTIDHKQNSDYHRRTPHQGTGFRPGRSCTSQLLNLTQHIEDGYQVEKVTGTAFVDLPAAYDTVNHLLLIQKLYNNTQDSKFCRIIQNLLSN